MVASIVRDEDRIFPCCARLSGQYGLRNMFLGVPVKLGKGGIKEVLKLKLNKFELKLLKKSADHVKDVMKTFNKMKVV